MRKTIISQIKFDRKGLIPAVVQDAKSGEVVMVGYMNAEALSKTLETGMMCYYSRSRNKLWMKGEESGNCQTVREMYIDCDNDTLLFKVGQKGGACHKGYHSCFFRKLADNKTEFAVTKERIFNPDEVYKK